LCYEEAQGGVGGNRVDGNNYQFAWCCNWVC
jgi:hypothetical protein